MHLVKPLLIVLLFMVCHNTSAQDFNAYQWKNRIILLKEANLDSDWLKAQIKRLQSDIAEMNERQLVVFILSDGVVYDIEQNKTDLDANIIVEQYGLSDFQGLALIGMDGGVKLKKEFIVNPKSIFELIDRMPIRQATIKDQ